MNNLVNDEQAKVLKEIGFDLPTHIYLYMGDTALNSDFRQNNRESKNHNTDSLCVSIPTAEQVFMWFYEKYNFESCVEPTPSNDGIKYVYNGYFYIFNNGEIQDKLDTSLFNKKSDCIGRLINDMIGIIQEINTIRKETGMSFEISLDRYLYFNCSYVDAIESIRSGKGICKTGSTNHEFLN